MGRGWLMWPALLAPAVVALVALVVAGGAAAPQEGLVAERPLVALSDRAVCSLLGPEKAAAGITGQDGSLTVSADGEVYWNFGDTLLADGSALPNGIAWSDDLDASDCISLTPLSDGRDALPMVPAHPGELSVWPMGMEEIGPGEVGFFYGSVWTDPKLGWQVRGVGIGTFDTRTHVATRELGGALIWGEDMPQPSRTFVDGQYVYVILTVTRETWTTDAILARVPKSELASPASYEYWDADDSGGSWVHGLWNAVAMSWRPSLNQIRPLWRQPGGHNGVQVAYNDFLGRWVAVYSTDFMSSVKARTAPSITGPWDATDAVLVHCPSFRPPGETGFVCYTGAQQAMYERDGGRTIYVTYSNERSYQVYLHEVRLAAPIERWSDGEGRTVYVPRSQDAPAGFSRDGVAFYASDIATPGFAAIHRWQSVEGGEIRYGALPPQPAGDYYDMGVDFYAPISASAAGATNEQYAPVYRWRRGDDQVYAAVDLSDAGYARLELAFYAVCPTDGDAPSGCVAAESTPVATPTPHASQIAGDVNCDGRVNAVDATLILQLDAMSIPSLGCGQNADASHDGRVTSIDALLVLQYVAGIIPSI